MTDLKDLTVIDDPIHVDFTAAELFNCRLVLAADQCNPLRLDEIDDDLAWSGYEPDPEDAGLYRSTFTVPSLRARAAPLNGPTEILHASGRVQRVEAGWIVQRIADPTEIFLVPQHEFVSHYARHRP